MALHGAAQQRRTLLLTLLGGTGRGTLYSRLHTILSGLCPLAWAPGKKTVSDSGTVHTHRLSVTVIVLAHMKLPA